jgi:hypothetical protein
MRKFNTLVLALLFAACCGSLALANASTVTFVSVNGLIDSSNYYVGPYTLQVDGANYQTMCYDFTHEVNFGQTWTANLYSFDNLGYAYYSYQPDYVSKYWEAAWLYTQLVRATDPVAMTGIQHAAWTLFNPGVAPGDGSATWLDAATAAHENNFADLDLSGFRVVNATGERPTVQGFIIGGYPAVSAQGGESDAPEAATYLMLATGLLCFGFVSSRRSRLKLT